MNKRFIVLDEKKKELSKEALKAIHDEKSEALKSGYEKNRQLTKKRLFEEEVNLRHVEGRIIIKIDLESKNTHTFESGVTIYRGRKFNDLNRRQTEPVNAWVVDAEYIPKGSEILIHPNAIVDANKIFNYANVSVEENNSLRYYSIEEPSCFLFREGQEWKPLKGFATALRVFRPYEGYLVGIEPELIKDVLYITSGEYNGKVCQTVKAADYEIIFQGTNGREQRIIRCRHYENESHDREELIVERNDLTELVNKGKLLVGLSKSDCKSIINETNYME